MKYYFVQCKDNNKTKWLFMVVYKVVSKWQWFIEIYSTQILKNCVKSVILCSSTCKSENAVYCISSTSGETGRSLSVKHPQSAEKNKPGFPVAEHFNSRAYTLSNFQVKRLRMRSGSGARGKQFEMEIIFKLGTVQPQRLKNVFHFK